jgi:hypothetical protein
MNRKSSVWGVCGWLLVAGIVAAAQTADYKPKYAGDPAHSDAEAVALGYMRTTLRAQNTYKRKTGAYATSLAQLVHTGTFTKRMTEKTQGDYTVSFRSHKDGFELSMTPSMVDANHRAFYATEDGKIHGSESGAANADSPEVKKEG